MNRPNLRCLALVVCVVGLTLFSGIPLRADEIDEASALGAQEATARLEQLLDKLSQNAEAQERDKDAQRIHALLADLRLQGNEPYAALQHLEVLARTRTSPQDLLRYAETLFAVAHKNMQARSTAAGVVPYLQDALAALDKMPKENVGGVPHD